MKGALAELRWAKRIIGLEGILFLRARGKEAVLARYRRFPPSRPLPTTPEGRLAQGLTPLAQGLMGEAPEASVLVDLTRERVHAVRLWTEEWRGEGRLEDLLGETPLPALPPFLPPLEVARPLRDWARPLGEGWPSWLLPPLLEEVTRVYPAWTRLLLDPGKGRFAVWERRKVGREEEEFPLGKALARLEGAR